ncbi:MAG: HEAT repeat domain-containing protein [Betaproteobacteria bacterium]
MHPIHTILASMLVMSQAAIAQSFYNMPAPPPPVVPVTPYTPATLMAPPTPPNAFFAPDAPRIIYLAEGQRDKAQAEADRKADQEEREAGKRARNEARRAPTEEESLALAAMEGLMSQPPQRALPIIKRVLAGSQSALVKQRALFVLSQIGEPEAQTILLDTARSGDVSLRREAIRNIGIGGNAKALAGLQDVYNAGDTAVRKQILEAWMIAGRKAEVYQAAVNAKSEADANNAIRMLSVMGAVEELRKLGDTQKPGRSLLEAYAISGDLASLRKIADGNGDVTMRGEAVRRIGIIGTEPARVALREIYLGTTVPQIRDAALQGMLIVGDQQGVLTLYRAAKTSEEKRALLRTLTVMGGDAALQAIDAALEGKK